MHTIHIGYARVDYVLTHFAATVCSIFVLLFWSSFIRSLKLSKKSIRTMRARPVYICDKWWQNKIETRLIQRTIILDRRIPFALVCVCLYLSVLVYTSI